MRRAAKFAGKEKLPIPPSLLWFSRTGSCRRFPDDTEGRGVGREVPFPLALPPR